MLHICINSGIELQSISKLRLELLNVSGNCIPPHNNNNSRHISVIRRAIRALKLGVLPMGNREPTRGLVRFYIMLPTRVAWRILCDPRQLLEVFRCHGRENPINVYATRLGAIHAGVVNRCGDRIRFQPVLLCITLPELAATMLNDHRRSTCHRLTWRKPRHCAEFRSIYKTAWTGIIFKKGKFSLGLIKQDLLKKVRKEFRHQWWGPVSRKTARERDLFLASLWK